MGPKHTASQGQSQVGAWVFGFKLQALFYPISHRVYQNLILSSEETGNRSEHRN